MTRVRGISIAKAWEVRDKELARLDQFKTPLFDAVKRYVDDKVIQFHVPGHKKGTGLKELRDYIGDRVFEMDANGMQELDFANNPTGVIYESERLLAQAFGAQNAFFLVGGTTAGVQAMIMSACEPGDKIIIPRNAHKSTIGGIILSGAMPVYVQPEINERLGIAMGITEESLRKAIKENPHAKALFLINPTYYGAASDLKALVRIAHRHDMAVLVDEAHGAHMCFHDDFPLTAMEVGADMSSASMHKTGGSLTQSSALLLRSNLVSPERVKQVLNLTHTTSSSYLLMCSLDVARKQIATQGSEMLEEALRLARMAREEINKIEGLYAFGKELIGTPGCYDIDETKLGISVAGLGYTGYEMEEKLRNEYNIQIELSDMHNIMGIVSIGDTEENIVALINALKDISSKTEIKEYRKTTIVPYNPKMIVSPRDAFYSHKKSVPLKDSVGEIAGEMIMAYPPGIPVICLGERITQDIIDYIEILKNQRCQMQGTADPHINSIMVLGVD
ncbi:MAG: aminotransferase class I/II-fold pyridoxal phosphate-dependent enzyme [Clostridiaceae bacterium]|jgi:arginine decarboxylase|nr:aminotransferase class I/II-fold pyridoxal phosphate-dependent enzyme [Clostridiaceae bacterium]